MSDSDAVLALEHDISAIDEEAVVAEIASALRAAFDAIGRRAQQVAPGQPLTKLRLSWAGAEVAPYVPSDVMSHAWAGDRKVVDCGPGFTPTPIDLVAHAAEENGSLPDEDGFDALCARALALSVELARRGCALAVASDAFRALPVTRPFRITARPGHGEPEVELIVVE